MQYYYETTHINPFNDTEESHVIYAHSEEEAREISRYTYGTPVQSCRQISKEEARR